MEGSLSAVLDGIEEHQLVDAVCELFSRCSHRQQLELLQDRLPRFLRRDFVSLLPPELVSHLLRFLTVRDVFRCLLVSRSWNRTITNSHSFWKNYTITSLGVPQSLLPGLLERHVSYKSAAVAVLQTRNWISSGRAVFQHYPNNTGKPPKATLTCRPALPSWNGLFVGHEVYAGSDGGTYRLSIRALDHSNSLVELTSIRVSQHFAITWCCSSPRHVLVHGSEGSWVQTRIISRETCDVRSNTWRGESVYNRSYYELGCCPECCLVVIARRAAREESWWDLLVTRLVEGREEDQKLRTSFQFLPFDSHHNSVFFRIHKLVVRSYSCEPDREGFCSKHKLLIQFGATICIFSLHTTESEDDDREIVVVQNLSKLCPFEDHTYYYTPSVLGHQFCLSSDDRFAAYLVGEDIFTWDLSSLELCQLNRRSLLPTNSDIVAVGGLYSVVYTSRMQTVRVVSTVSGETLFNHRISYMGDNPMYGPPDQFWLNDVDGVEKSVPLAITLQKWQTPGVWLLKS